MVDLLYKVSGNVAYTDDSNGSFESTHQNGVTWTTIEIDAQADFAQAYTDEATAIDALLTLFSGATHSISVAAPTADKTVSDFVMEISGRFARDDNTWEDFCVQYRDGGNVTIQNDGAYTEVVANSTFLTYLNTIWDSLTNNNAVIVAA